jgi:hypothetical protein
MNGHLLVDAGLLIVAIFALAFTGQAQRQSRRSADASERSADAAEKSATAANRSADAAERSAREAERANDLRQVERDEVLAERDRTAVSWKVRPMAPGRYRLWNTGSERAVDVRIAGDGITYGDNMKDHWTQGKRRLLVRADRGGHADDSDLSARRLREGHRRAPATAMRTSGHTHHTSESTVTYLLLIADLPRGRPARPAPQPASAPRPV